MQGLTSARVALAARRSIEKEARTAKRVQDSSRRHSNKDESYSRQEKAEIKTRKPRHEYLKEEKGQILASSNTTMPDDH